MKILLLNPLITAKERYGGNSSIGAAGGMQLPLSLCYIGAVLREVGHKIKIIDMEAERINDAEIIPIIKQFNPDIIGLTSTTVAFYRCLALAKKIKKNFNLPIIIGGSHVSAIPDKTMEFKEFNYGVLNEGEITVVELVDAIKNKKDISKVKGVMYRNNKGKVKFAGIRPYIKDLDSLPLPARDLVNMKLYHPPSNNYRAFPVASMITSRGCPHRCTFCDRNVHGQIYRAHSSKKVVEEIEHLIKNYGVKEIAFEDDTFLINKNRVYEILNLIVTKKIEVPSNKNSFYLRIASQ